MHKDVTVKMELVDFEKGLPLVVRCLSRDTKLSSWVRGNRELVDDKLCCHGAVLFRDFAVEEQGDFEAFVDEIAPKRLDYVYRSTPRTSVGANIYTATEYPRQETIPLHCENAYQQDWPMKLMFYCAQAAEGGGATTLANMLRVTEHLGKDLVDEFAKRKVMYVRNYGAGVDLPWETVFQTNRREDVERYCASNGIEIEWKEGGGLRTRQVCQGVTVHPRTKDVVWFNQVHLFHVSLLDKKTRAAMLRLFKEEDLPRNSYYGDGAPIDEALIERIRDVFLRECVPSPWQKGDVMLVDNMLAAHGRSPYTGTRRVLVAMGEPFSAAAGVGGQPAV